MDAMSPDELALIAESCDWDVLWRVCRTWRQALLCHFEQVVAPVVRRMAPSQLRAYARRIPGRLLLQYAIALADPPRTRPWRPYQCGVCESRIWQVAECDACGAFKHVGMFDT